MTPGVPMVNAGETPRDLRLFACAGNGSGIKAIRCSGGVLDHIRRRATEQFLSIPRGGLEVGGLLYGSLEHEEILIIGFTELTVEYINGPSFKLSPQDEINLQQALTEQQPGTLVGWWHSHTRSDTSLTDDDADVHSRFFGDRAPLALIIKPHKFDPAEIAVYIANANGVPGPAPCCRFTTGDEEPDIEPERAAVVVAQPPPPPPPAVESEPPVRYVATAVPARPPNQRRKRFARMALAALVFLGSAVGTALLRTVPESDPLHIDLAKSPNGLTIRWSVDAPVAEKASSAELSIVDERGRSRTLTLQPNEVRSGSVMYDQTTERLQIRLRVRLHNNDIHDATANFIGGTAPPAPVQAARTEVPVRNDAEVQRLKDEITRMRTAEVTKIPEVPKSAVVPTRMARIPPPATAREVPMPQVGPPPALQISGVASPAVPAIVSAPASLPAPKPAPAKLSSGRAIWTGTLTAGSTLLIDGKRPTMGALTGGLPNRPVRIRVHAADLLESGLVIYTRAGDERLERPSAANGWNLTTYRPDPRRSGSVAVLETPAPGNGWQRLMVRTNSRPLTALVIDWDELPPQ